MSETVAVIGFAQAPNRPSAGTTSGVETLVPVFREALDSAGLDRREVDFWCSGSSDYLAGRAFSFVSAVDAIGAVPPIAESHVEADGAWALYEAWVRLQHGDIDSALVYASGKSSMGNREEVMGMQLDPYYLAPLWLNYTALAWASERTQSTIRSSPASIRASHVPRSRIARLIWNVSSGSR